MQYPVYNFHRMDADRDALAEPCGHADTAEAALAIARKSIAAAVGDGFGIDQMELAERHGIEGWFVAR